MELRAGPGAGEGRWSAEGQVRSEREPRVEEQLVASGTGRDAADRGGEAAVARIAQAHRGGPDRQAGRALSRRRDEAGGVPGGQDVAVGVDGDGADGAVCDEEGG